MDWHSGCHHNRGHANRAASYISRITLVAAIGSLFPLAPLIISTDEQMRFRNSLVVELGEKSSLTWSPDEPPAAYHSERELAPTHLIQSAVVPSSLRRETREAWPAVLDLAKHLTQGPGVGEPLQAGTIDTYTRIIAEKGGYCADYRRAFTGLCLAAGIAVRQWGMTFNNFGEDGHAFNEVFIPEWRKWVFIDSYYSFFLADARTSIPLSVLEFNGALRRGSIRDAVRVVPIVSERFTFSDSQTALEYYRTGSDEMFLLMRNDVFSYDRHILNRVISPISRKLAQAAAIAIGTFPKLTLIPSEDSRQAINRLYAMRDRYLHRIALFVLLTSCWLLQVTISQYRRRANLVGNLGPTGE